MERKREVLLGNLVFIAVAIPVLLYAYSTGPPAAKTGAPGENTCTQCHSGGLGGGRVEIAFSAGATYAPGVAQQLTVTITDADANWYGFELSARLAGDNSQAGTLARAPGESNIRVICSDNRPRGAGGCPANAPIEYIEHSPARQGSTFRIEWMPPATDRGLVTIYVAANGANGNGSPTGDDIYTANYTLTPQAVQPPSLTSAGIVNAASFSPGMSPGSFIAIYGENLATVTRSWDGAIQGTTLPTKLEGVSVTVGGRPAYPAYLSPTQLNVLLPTDELTGPVEVKVTTPQGSASASVAMQRHLPGLFPLRLDRQYVVATHGDNVLVAKVGSVASVTSRPARPGETIVLWGTGFGPTTPQAPSGRVLAGAYPLATPNDLQVTIGGTVAQVAFAGVTVAGVCQINVVVPAGLPDGDHLVQAAIGGARTQDNAFVPVQAASTAVAGLQVAYRLDPWLISGNYGSGFWASPPVLGPATQGGGIFTLETRAEGLDAQGQPVAVNPQWIASDPGMVTVSPGQGSQVTITIQGAGQSTLRLASDTVTKDLVIKAASQGGVLTVEIAQ